MAPILQNVFDNPILTRELRRRMRGKGLVYSIIGYIVIMTITTMAVLLSHASFGGGKSGVQMLTELRETGESLFGAISTIQMLLVLIIAPTITAGMTTGEKERKTFDFLRVTTITPWMYITGCFLSTVFYVALALLCALPLISLAFLYGGVGAADVVARFGMLLGGSLVLSAFGLYMSSIRERTRTAQGIVVFLIFAMIFGGISVWNTLQSFFGSGLASAATGPSAGAPGTMPVFNLAVPYWVFGAIAIGYPTVLFLLMATRKLFDPDETRALSHWQFAALALVLLLGALGGVSGRPITEREFLAFAFTGAGLLGCAAVCFGVGRMEVGDEIWQLKRLVPALRPFDPTVPFLLGVAGCWWLACKLFHDLPTGSTTPAGAVDSLFLSGLAGFAFFCAVARFATAQAAMRKNAARTTTAVILALWVFIPVLCTAVGAVWEGSIFAAAAGFLGTFSPLYLAMQSLGTSGAQVFGRAGLGAATPGSSAAAIYLVLGAIVLAAGEFKRWRRWRGFDYHYDMPAR